MSDEPHQKSAIRELADELIAKDAVIQRLTKRLEGLRGAVLPYVEWFGAAHSEDCPGDDTCDCLCRSMNDALNKAIREATDVRRATPVSQEEAETPRSRNRRDAFSDAASHCRRAVLSLGVLGITRRVLFNDVEVDGLGCLTSHA